MTNRQISLEIKDIPSCDYKNIYIKSNEFSIKGIYDYSIDIQQPLIKYKDYLLVLPENRKIYVYDTADINKQIKRYIFQGFLPQTLPNKQNQPPFLVKEVRGVLAFPYADKIYLWDMASTLALSNVQAEPKAATRQIPEYLELEGELIADLATDGLHYLAAAVRSADNRYYLKVFEFTSETVTEFYSMETEDLSNAHINLYCTELAVYLLIKRKIGMQNDNPQYEAFGRLKCLNLASFAYGELEGSFTDFDSRTKENINSLIIRAVEHNGRNGHQLCRIENTSVMPKEAEIISGLNIYLYSYEDDHLWLCGSCLHKLNENGLNIIAPYSDVQIMAACSPITISKDKYIYICSSHGDHSQCLHLIDNSLNQNLAIDSNCKFNASSGLIKIKGAVFAIANHQLVQITYNIQDDIIESLNS